MTQRLLSIWCWMFVWLLFSVLKLPSPAPMAVEWILWIVWIRLWAILWAMLVKKFIH